MYIIYILHILTSYYMLLNPVLEGIQNLSRQAWWALKQVDTGQLAQMQ